MAIQVTDEMRQAVLAEICATTGHSVELGSMLGATPDDPSGPRGIPMRPIGPEGKLPHIWCDRCKKVLGVFIAIEDDDYDKVEQRLAGMLRDKTELEKRRRPRRGDNPGRPAKRTDLTPAPE